MAQNTTINLTLDATQTDLPAGTAVYAYIVGLVTGSTNLYYWVNASGMPQVMSTNDNTQPASTFVPPPGSSLSTDAITALAGNYPLAWADYSIPVSLTTPTVINLANINTTNIPTLGTGTAAFSGRIYLSVGLPKLPFTPIATAPATQASGYTAPVPILGPGALTLFDWIEFSFDSNQNFNGNTTQVDQFGFQLMLNGTPGGSLQGAFNMGRAAIINQAGPTVPGPFGGGVLQVPVPSALATGVYPVSSSGTGINFLRMVSPKTLTAEPGYSGALATFFDCTIASWYTTWQTTPLVTNDQSTGYYSGYVSNGVLNFYQGNYPTLAALQAANPPLQFSMTGTNPATNVILTSDVWQCVNTLATGTAAQKNVGKMIAAAFNRGCMSNLLDDSTCSQNVASFYPANGTWNAWASSFHNVSVNTLAYGFPYDDVCNQNPTVALSPASGVTVTLGNFFT